MLSTSTTISDPNIGVRLDGPGLREGRAVRDGWWDGYGVRVSLGPAPVEFWTGAAI